MKIIGEKKPIVGVTEMYSVIDSNGVLFTSNMNKVTYAWYIFKKYKNGAFVNVTKNNIPKTGQSVPYSFGYNVEYRLDIYKLEKELLTQKDKASFVASYFVNPTKKSSKAEIKKVVLYNKGAKNVDLAGIGNSLTVRVECINMVNKQVKVHVWNAEDKSEPNFMNSKLIDINDKGIGLAQFNVMQLLSPTESMNLMIGNIKAIGFFVTATYEQQSVTNKTPVVVVSEFQSMADIFESARSMSSYNDNDAPETSNDGKCPNCEKDITWNEIKEIFGDSDKDFRMNCVNWINKYKLNFGINTCAKKAHFLSQIAAETHFRKDEMCEGKIKYIPKNIRSGIFGERGKILDKRGQIEEFCDERPDQKKLFNFLYAAENGFGNGNGNEASGDGFNFRGKGLIQLTGKGNYKSAMGLIKEYVPSNIYQDLISSESRKKHFNEFKFNEGRKEKTLKNVDLFDFITYYDMPIEPKYAVLSALADWKGKGLSDSVLVVNDVSIVEKIRKKINLAGLNTNVAKEYFKKGVIALSVDECKTLIKENTEIGEVNIYKIEIEKFLYSKIKENNESKKYQYQIYENNKLIKTYTLQKNQHGLIPFPESGPNWGRFGTRDKGGDNWINEKVCAALLGFFYSLPKNGYSKSLYFNDISADDGRNIGHSGHNLNGNDVDIRYPGSTNGGRTYWYDAMKNYVNENAFIADLENIIAVGVKWNFIKNYAYKKEIKNTTGKALSVHQDHFHLGLR